MKNPLVLILLLGLALTALGCSNKNDEGKVIAANDQKQIEAAMTAVARTDIRGMAGRMVRARTAGAG